MKHLRGRRSASTFHGGDRDEVTAVELIEQQLFGIGDANRGLQIIRQMVMEALHELEQVV